MSQKDKDIAFFTVWLINCVAQAWEKPAPDVYEILQSAELVDGYIIPFYDVLHTMGKEALVYELTEAAREKGVLE